MNKFLGFLAISTIISCTSQVSKEEVSQGVVTDAKKDTPLNPNLASKQELFSLDLVDEKTADLIIENRPYLSFSQFDSLLSLIYADDKIEILRQAVFLPINLNYASEDDFKKVPGVGEKMAHEFEEYRPYISTNQFRREIGKYVSKDEIANYEKYVYVPLKLNEASKEEILRIPGVGDKMAHELEEYRPYKNMDHFRREIGKYVDEIELKRLERYVRF